MKKAIFLFSVCISLFFVRITVAEVSSTQFVGNTESKLIHSYDCNHLPDKKQQVLFNSKTEAEKVGYRECTVCFKVCPEILGYVEESALGLEMAARLRYYYPLSIKGKPQERLQAIGKKVVTNWPFPERGYSYEFRVVQSKEINAWAVPTGFIYVTSELMNIVESDEELEAILAHEIAHVERRHGYREYKRLSSVFFAGDTLAIMATAVRVETRILQIADMLHITASRLVLFGYNRDNERESDILAELCLRKLAKSEKKLLLYLRKIKYLEGRQKHKTGIFSIHPGIEDRINRLEITQINAFENKNVFIGVDNKGYKVAKLHLLWEELYQRNHKISAVLTVEKEDLLGPFVAPPVAGPFGMGTSFSQEKLWLSIFCSGKKLELKVKNAVVEGLNVEVSFSRHSAGLLDRPIHSLNFNLPGIERWKMLKD